MRRAGCPAPLAGPSERASLTHLDRRQRPHGRRRSQAGDANDARERGRAFACRRTPRAAIATGNAPKGEVLGTARLAGILAAKQTAQLIPLAHPIPLSFVDVQATVDVERGLVELISEVSVAAQTGVEMEAMVACTSRR